jgi:hypothetical protein
MAFTLIDRVPARYTCKSADTKQTDGIPVGAELKETDTGREYKFDGTAWIDQNATELTQTAVSVGATSTSVLAAKAGRKYALIINDSDSTIYLKIGSAAALNTGIRLNANGGSYEMYAAAGNLDTRAINAISSGAGKTLLVTEG